MSRFRLLPTSEQEQALLGHCRDARYVWNLAVEQQQHWQPGRKAPGYVGQCAQLREARAEYAWLRAGSQRVQQQALRDFAQAMSNFFAGTHRRPTWRKAGVHEGFRQVGLKSYQVERLNRRFGRVWVPKVGWVRFRLSRPVPGGVKSYRVTRDRAGRWHIAFAHIPDPVAGPGDCSVVGVDRRVAVSAALSTGELLHTPGLSPGEAKRLRVLQRGTAEQPGTRVAQKRGLNRSISRSGWGQVVARLQHKAFGRVEQVPAAYTSQRCSACGHVAPENRKSQAVFECQACTARRAVTARGDLADGRSANREPQLSTPAA